MWKASGNNMIMGTDLTVDTSNTAKKLFTLTSTGEGKLKNAVYTKFKALLDNYVPDELKPEVDDPKEATEEDDFINTIAVEGGPMDIAFKYLQAAGKTTTANLNAFKPVLKTMWFAKYAKGDNVNQYSGFEHTFVGETGLDKKKKNLVVKGLHNWYQFHLEQTAGRLTYTPPPTNKVDTTKKPPFINVKFSWKGVNKPPGSSFYVGTSPAFEMALYTACFFGEPGDCTCNIGGVPVTIKTIPFRDTDKVLTSYPTA